jgi:hypothetical protein
MERIIFQNGASRFIFRQKIDDGFFFNNFSTYLLGLFLEQTLYPRPVSSQAEINKCYFKLFSLQCHP